MPDLITDLVYLLVLPICDLQGTFLPCRLGVGIVLLWLSTDPDPWRLAGTEGGREVGVWSGDCCDVNTYAIYSPCC